MLIFQSLDWDSQLFGFPVARLCPATLSLTTLQTCLQNLKSQGVKLVFWASDSTDAPSQSAAKACQGVLADQKVTYVMELPRSVFPRDSAVELYEEKIVTPELEALAFSIGKESRFFCDKKMPSDAYQKMYRAWMINSVNRSIAEAVLVVREHNKIIAMVTLNEKNKRGNIDLIAVDAAHQGKGWGRKCVEAAHCYFQEKKYKVMQVVTQKTNTSACQLYERCGYRLEKCEHFYHFWLS